MSITRLQQARQMYALGQRVAKTLDGSRPGYKGRTDANTMSGSGYGAGSSTGSNKGGDNKVDPGFQNALRTQAIRNKTIENQNNKDYGQFFGTRVPTYQTPTFGQRIGQGVGNLASGVVDFYKQGGVLGAATRGLGSLLEGIFGPPVPSTGNVGPAGIKTDGTYGTVEDAIKASGRNERSQDIGGEGGQDSYILPLYAQDNTIEDIDGDGIISLQDIVLIFQGADRTLDPSAVGLQDTDQLRKVIQERVKNLYT